MRLRILSLVAALGVSSTAMAASSFYDGRYTGSARPTSRGIGCEQFSLNPMLISAGTISSSAGGDAKVEGVVADDGSVTGRIARNGKPGADFEGRFENGFFRGRIISDTDRCDWAVKFDLAKSTSD